MKILILCDMFPPAFGPRMGYLCKYLKKAGWQPVVVTEYIEDKTFSFLAKELDVTYVNFYKASGTVFQYIEWLMVFLADFLLNYKDRKMTQVASKLLAQGGYSGILCSTYRTFPLPAAYQLSKRFQLPFIADTRDILEQYASTEYIAHSFRTFPFIDKFIIGVFKKKLLQGRNKALSAANYITTVSPWHVQIMSQFNSNVALIYNGFDPEIFYPEKIPTSQFRVTYTGRLLSLATRDPQLLFEAIALLSQQNLIQPQDFRVQWYIDKTSKEILQQQANLYGVIEFMDFYNYVPAAEIPKILNRSSVLLQLANLASGKGPKGIMTTKLFESLAVEKPLLCVRSDESYLEKVINNAHAGLAARDVNQVYNFLYTYYQEWKEKGYTTIQINKDVVDQFSRRQQAKQFMDIFEKVV
ncbi:MAG: hypothetical protein LIP06_14895 [Tannerellaceae bacterium]|nr:hypothetical protein [Tannerellaceae bacterium]